MTLVEACRVIRDGKGRVAARPAWRALEVWFDAGGVMETSYAVYIELGDLVADDWKIVR